MPGMGRPAGAGSNTFSNIRMRAPKNKGEFLNKLAGITQKSKFVDATEHNKIGKDGFLKLLATQLANQDPTNPMDQKKFAADLAQFSQLEQLTNLNKKFEKSDQEKVMKQKFYAASFLGKEVTTKGTTILLQRDGEDADIPFYLSKDAKKVMVRIFDQKNNLIGQIDTQNMSAGSHRLRWDGVSLDNTPAIKGEYRIEVTGWDNSFEKFSGETRSAGIVTGVSFENGETILKLDGQKSINLRDVENFQLPRHNKSKTPTANAQNRVKQYSQTMREM